MRNPRRAHNAGGTAIPPMNLANMRENGVRSVEATWKACGREAVVNCDELPADLPVPDVALRSWNAGAGMLGTQGSLEVPRAGRRGARPISGLCGRPTTYQHL